MGNRRRARPFREVKSRAFAIVGSNADIATVSPSLLIQGLSSLLNLGIHVAFYPGPGVQRPTPGDFAGNTFQIYGWTADDRGQRIQLSDSPVTGSTPIPAPDGWSGDTDLDALEVRGSFYAMGIPGEWRLNLVLEPIDGAMCEETFTELAAQVDIEAIKAPTVDGAGS